MESVIKNEPRNLRGFFLKKNIEKYHFELDCTIFLVYNISKVTKQYYLYKKERKL